MKNNSIENNIKQSFDHYQPNLDHDEIWDNIEPHLHRKKRRRFLWLWFLLAGILLGTWTYKIGWVDKKQASETSNTLAPQAVKENQTIEKTPPLAATEIPDPTSNQQNISKLTPRKSSKKQKIASADIPIFPLVSTTPIQNNVASILIDESKPEATPSTDKKPGLSETKTDKVAIEDTYIWYHHTKRSHFLLDKYGPREIDPRKKHRKRRKIKPLRKKKWQFIGQATVAPILPIRFLGLNLSNDGTYLTQRKETESALEAYGLNINLQVQHRSGWLLVAGLEYQQFNERFSRTEITVREEIEIGVIAVVEDAAGNVIETITGPKIVTTTTEEEIKIHNNYRFWNVPFGIGRAWRKGRWINKLMLGLQYNLGFRVSGAILNEDLEPIELKKDFLTYNQIFKPKLGWGAWISAEFNRPINNQVMLTFAPKLQIPFSKLTTEDYGLSQRYSPISLNMGVSYLINPPKKRKRGRPNAIN